MIILLSFAYRSFCIEAPFLRTQKRSAFDAPQMGSGGDLCSRAVSSQVLSALKGLTSVFGMGTGGTPSSLPPEIVDEVVSFSRAPDPALRETISAASQLFPPHVAAAALCAP